MVVVAVTTMLLIATITFLMIRNYIQPQNFTISVSSSTVALLGEVNNIKYSDLLVQSQDALVSDVVIIIAEQKKTYQDNENFAVPLSNFSGLNDVYALAGSQINLHFSNVSGPNQSGFAVFVFPQGSSEAVCIQRFAAEQKSSSLLCTVTSDGSYNIELVVGPKVLGTATYNLSLIMLNSTYYHTVDSSNCTLSPKISNCSLSVSSNGLVGHNYYVIALIDHLASEVTLILQYVGRKDLYWFAILSIPFEIILVAVIVLLIRITKYICLRQCLQYNKHKRKLGSVRKH